MNEPIERPIQLLTHLWRGGNHGYLWMLSEDSRSKSSQWMLSTSPAPEMARPDWHNYYGVHPSRTRRGRWQRARVNDIAAINCIFAEFDAKDYGSQRQIIEHLEALYENGVPAPSIIIDSGGGYHCLWLLDEPYYISNSAERERAKFAQAGWVAFVGGDTGAKDLARVLRLPGTRNIKPEYAPNYPLCDFEQANFNALYSLEELIELLPEVGPAPEPPLPPAAAATVQVPETGLAYASSALNNLTERLTNAASGTRNHTLYSTASRLFELVGAGLLDESTVRYELEHAARLNGMIRDDGERSFNATVESAKRNGLSKPNPRLPTFGNTALKPAPVEPPAPPPLYLVEGKQDEDDGNINLVAFEPTDEGNAETVHALYGGHIMWVEVLGWLCWNGSYWQASGAEAQVQQYVVDTLRARRHAAVEAEREAIVKAAKTNKARISNAMALLKKHVERQIEELDNHQWLLNVGNGVLDLRDGTVHPHDPSYMFTSCIPTPYVTNADPSEWIDFVSVTVDDSGDFQMIDYLQRVTGYILTGSTREECLFYLWGPPRSGKGTFTEVLYAALGGETSPLVEEAPFALFTEDASADRQNHQLAEFRTARLILASESNDNEYLNAARIKSITGGNRIFCAHKYMPFFSYRPRYKVLLSSNEPPKGRVEDEALWASRLKVIEFPHSKLGQEDMGLKERLLQPAVLEGVLAWAVEGAMAWYTNGLGHPEQVVQATQRARNELDSVGQWLEECCGAEAGAFTSNTDLYDSYAKFCEEVGFTPKGKIKLGTALSNKGYDSGVKKISGRTYRGRAGLIVL